MQTKSRILIVDDSAIGRQTLEGLLLNQDCDLDYAVDGLNALEKASALKPDLILLDVMMPHMDGFEVCRRLRADPLLAEVPVVIVTALDDKESRLRGIEAGADDFVTKPFDRIELRARVKTIIRLNRYRKLRDEHERLVQAHNDLQDTYSATIEGWVHALDLRDKETEGHTQRVTAMAVDMARSLGLGGEAQTHVRRGALMHDIGKLGVPDEILLKPGPLTDAEWVIMRLHTTYAHDWLYPIAYLRPALDIPYCHHEKWDGTGYPRQLKGEEIPLAARLFALVDVWDALRSDRPYRTSWSADKVTAHIRGLVGTHFDPQLVELFLSIANQSESSRQS
jgi:putative two-component system response regulator